MTRIMPAHPKIRVLVADSQLLLSDALACSLRGFDGIDVLEEHPDSGLVVIDLVELLLPDVLIVEYWMPWLLAPAITTAIHAKAPGCKVIVISWMHGSREILNSLYAGAVGFLPKNVRVERVAEAIRRSQEGESPVFREQLDQLMKTLGDKDERSHDLWDRMKGLSRRQLQILALLSTGRPLKEIAQALDITPKTAKNYLYSMMTKAGAQSQVELLALARKCGLIAD